MGILNLQPVSRRGMRLLISLYGMSETGKTLSALKLAAGIEPDPSKRALMDTEGGQRGRAYMDKIAGGYVYGSLSPPYTPERYIEALNDVEAAGINVLVIDSGSHAWFAEGGVLDMVEESTVKNDLGKWIAPKRRLRKMTNRMLSSDMHIIICARGKQPMIETTVDGRKKLMPGPVVPIQEKTLRFDMTVMALMLGDGRFSVAAPDGKCPGDLRPIFSSSELMNEEMGQKIASWIGGADVRTPAQRRLEIDATAAAEQGTDPFREFFKKITADDRAYLKPRLGNYQSIATAADEERKRDAEAAKDNANLDDPFGSSHDPDTGEIHADQNSPAAGGNPADAQSSERAPAPGKTDAAAPPDSPTGGASTKGAPQERQQPKRDEAFWDGADLEIPAPRHEDRKPDWHGWGARMVALIEVAKAGEIDVLRSHNANSRQRCLAAADPKIVGDIDKAFAAAEKRVGG